MGESEFPNDLATWAGRDLRDRVLAVLHPLDKEALADAIDRAFGMSRGERRERMIALRRQPIKDRVLPDAGRGPLVEP